MANTSGLISTEAAPTDMWTSGLEAADNSALIEFLKAYRKLRTTFSVLGIAMAVATIILNGILLWSFVKYKLLNRKPNIFFFSLSLGDVLAGVAVLHVSVMNQFFIKHPSAEASCVAAAALHLIANGVSLYSMMGAAWVHYLYIGHPYTYARYQNSSVHLVIVCVMWLWILVSGGLTFIGHVWQPGKECYLTQIVGKAQFSILPLGQIFTLLAIITVLFMMILCLAKRQRILVAAQGTNQQPEVADSRSTGNQRRITSGGKDGEMSNVAETANVLNSPETIQRKRKGTHLVIALIGVMYICWFPLCVIILTRVALPDRPITLVYIAIAEICNLLLYSSSLLNPLIYQRFSPDVVRAYRNCFRGRDSPTVAP